MMTMCRSSRVDRLIFSIMLESILYMSSVQFGIRVLVVSSCNSFGQGINVDLVAM